MLSKISRNTFEDAVGDPTRRRALAIAVILKDRNLSSVYKDWTYRSLASVTGLSPNTIRKYIPVLRAMRLARTYGSGGHRYLEVKKLRRKKIKNKHNDGFHTPKSSDVDIAAIGKSSVREVERGLMSLELSERARKTDYMRRLIKLGTNPSKSDPVREVRRARAICRKRSLKEFVERGLSYRKIARVLRCGPNTVKSIIALGESIGLFKVERRDIVLVRFIGGGRAKEALEYFKDEYPTAFATLNNIYYQPSLIFQRI